MKKTDIQEILVVDDTPGNLELLTNILASHGYRIRSASSGRLALRSVAVKAPDLILLDVRMPEMDGYEVCRYLKDDERYRDIPVIFISALDELSGKVRGFETGGVDYITKPFASAEVLARVKTHLRLRHLQVNMEALVKQRTEELSRANVELTAEIAERFRAEDDLRRTNRLFKMLSECNQTLVHAKDESTLFHDVCRNIVEIGGYAMACIGFAGQGEGKLIHIAASAGCAETCLTEGMKLSWGDTAAGRNPLGMAIRTGESVVREGLRNDSGFGAWCPDAARRDCLSVFAIPLFTAGCCVPGALSVQMCVPGECSPEETKLLAELAGDLAYGVNALRVHDERRKTAEELSRKEARLQSIVRSSPTGIAIISDRIFRDVNERFCEMLGYEKEELIGNSIRQIYESEEDFNQAGMKAYAELAMRGTANIETRFRRKDGGVIDVLLSSAVITSSGDYPEISLAVSESSRRKEMEEEFNFTVLDITERKRMEQELLDSAVRYRTIFENTGTAMVIIEEDTVISLANAEFAEVVGYARDEIEGKMKWTVFVPQQEFLDPMKKYHQARRVDPSGAPKTYESRMQAKSGHIAEVVITVVMMPGTTKSVASIIDITEQKKLEARIRQAQKMEAIGTLAGGIAHDFNNILSAIIGYTNLALIKSTMDSNLRHYIEQIYQAGERAKDLVNQILTFSRQTEQELKPVPVALIAKEVLKLLRSTLPTTIEICQDISTSFQRDIVLADPTQIHQVLMNLCTNAAQAMSARGGVLSVKVSKIEADAALIHGIPDLQPGHYVVLTVRDTGQGMDATIVERIFDPYFTTKPPGEGTGLGLAVVIGIVKKLRGAITVSSEPDKGSVFRVYLPGLQEQASEQSDTREDLSTGSERILLVDDETVLVELLREMLESLGYHVITSTASLDALKTFRSIPDKFDLIFTDMTMPKMTGIELARQCREIRPDVPIILSSGYSELINDKTVKEAGICEFVTKPYDISQIAKILRRALATGEK